MMRLLHITMRGLLMGVAWTAVPLAAYLALLREEGDTLFGFVILATCVTCLAVVVESRAHDRCRTAMGRDGAGSRWRVSLKSLALSVVLIGVPDAAFLATYLLSSGGRWYVVPYVDGPLVPNVAGVGVGVVVAVGTASLLRLALWPGERRVPLEVVPTASESVIAEV